jgi:hypothetical protein
MSLSNPLPRGTRTSPVYVGDGATTTFAVPFWFLSGLDLEIIVTTAGVPVSFTGGVGYTTTGAGVPGGGTVTLAAAPAAGALVQVLGLRIPNRTTSVVNGGSLISAALETELDIETATMQELRRDVSSAQAQAAAAVVAAGTGWSPQGAWSATTAYAANALVFYSNGSYVAIAPSTNVTPGTNPSLWQQVAAQGPTGATGPAGANAGVSGVGTINFGAFPGSDTASVSVSDGGVASNSALLAQISYADSADHSADEHLVEEIDVIAGSITAGVGFLVAAKTRNLPLYGQFNFAWRRS